MAKNFCLPRLPSLPSPRPPGYLSGPRLNHACPHRQDLALPIYLPINFLSADLVTLCRAFLSAPPVCSRQQTTPMHSMLVLTQWWLGRRTPIVSPPGGAYVAPAGSGGPPRCVTPGIEEGHSLYTFPSEA